MCLQCCNACCCLQGRRTSLCPPALREQHALQQGKARATAQHAPARAGATAVLGHVSGRCCCCCCASCCCSLGLLDLCCEQPAAAASCDGVPASPATAACLAQIPKPFHPIQPHSRTSTRHNKQHQHTMWWLLGLLLLLQVHQPRQEAWQMLHAAVAPGCCCCCLLSHLVDCDDLAVGLLHTAQPPQEVPVELQTETDSRSHKEREREGTLRSKLPCAGRRYDRGAVRPARRLGVLQHRSCSRTATAAATAVLHPPAAAPDLLRPMQLPKPQPDTHQNLLLARTASWAHTFMR